VILIFIIYLFIYLWYLFFLGLELGLELGLGGSLSIICGKSTYRSSVENLLIIYLSNGLNVYVIFSDSILASTMATSGDIVDCPICLVGEMEDAREMEDAWNTQHRAGRAIICDAHSLPAEFQCCDVLCSELFCFEESHHNPIMKRFDEFKSRFATFAFEEEEKKKFKIDKQIAQLENNLESFNIASQPGGPAEEEIADDGDSLAARILALAAPVPVPSNHARVHIMMARRPGPSSDYNEQVIFFTKGFTEGYYLLLFSEKAA
jgi:hypothetical protein